MKKPFKPADYNSVSPYFIVTGAQQLVDMLKQVFNGEVKRRFDRPDGKIMHAEVQIDDSVLMIADSTDGYPSNQFLMHVYVPDVDDTFNKAISYGCESVEQPTQRVGDPNRRGTFKDFAGNHWSVGTQL
jgi:PhnB protein